MLAVTMMPQIGLMTAYATGDAVTIDGGIILSDGTGASELFGVHANCTEGVITLQSDLVVRSPIVFQSTTFRPESASLTPDGHTVTLDLNGHSITGAAGTTGSDKTAATGVNAIELQPAGFNLVIKGPGAVTGGKGAIYETEAHMKRGADGGIAVCFTSISPKDYWFPNPDLNNGKLEYGLKVDGSAVLTGGDGADITGEEWVYNIGNYDDGDRYSNYSNPMFRLIAGKGGAGIGQTDAGIECGASTIAYNRIDLIKGAINGGSGGNLDLGTANSPVLTHYGLMNSPAISSYMQELHSTDNTYDIYVASNYRHRPGDGGDGIVIGAGRKYLNVAKDVVVTGGMCGGINYGKSKYVNRIDKYFTVQPGNGIAIYGDLGIENTDTVSVSETDWSTRTETSEDMGVFIAGSVTGGAAPDASAMLEYGYDGGAGIMINGDEDYILTPEKDDYGRNIGLVFPNGENPEVSSKK